MTERDDISLLSIVKGGEYDDICDGRLGYLPIGKGVLLDGEQVVI